MRIVFASLIWLLPLQALAADLICLGADDGLAIQASLDAGGTTRLEGTCVAGPLMIRRDRTTLMGQALLHTAGLMIQDARRVAIRDLEIHATGNGVTLAGSTILVSLDNVYIDSGGHGVVADATAGLWMRGVHLNGHPGNPTYGITLGRSAAGFEAAWITDSICETHYGCLRVGGSGADGNILNAWITNFVMDRTFVGIVIAPGGAASARNILISGCWARGQEYPILLSSVETTGQIRDVRVEACVFIGTPRTVTISGPAEHVQVLDSLEALPQ